MIRGHRQYGFTLVELMVVIVVIALLSALAVPSLIGTYQRAALRSEARQLYEAARYTQRLAVLKRRTFRLAFELADMEHDGRSSYRIELMSDNVDDAEPYSALTSGAVKPTVLPPAVRIAQVLVDNPNAEMGSSVITFFPDGSADAAVVQLTDDHRTYSVLVDPGTGELGYIEEAVDMPPNLREDLDA